MRFQHAGGWYRAHDALRGSRKVPEEFRKLHKAPRGSTHEAPEGPKKLQENNYNKFVLPLEDPSLFLVRRRVADVRGLRLSEVSQKYPSFAQEERPFQ